MNTTLHIRAGTFALIVLASGIAACNGGSEAAPDAEPDGNAAATMEASWATDPSGLSAMEPWVRTAIRPEGSDDPDAPPVNSAAYFVLRNAGEQADAIMRVDTEVADTAELHSVTMDGGVMRMRAVDSIPVPAGGEAVLEPGGFHVMLIGIHQPLGEGDSVPLTLRLRSGNSVQVVAPVRSGPPGG